MSQDVDGSDKGNILVVDDTPVNLKLLSELLIKNGYRVRAVRDGNMALMSVQTNLPELVLLDIKMPEMDGYEVCQHLKADSSTEDIPVIFISALNDADDIVKAFEVGGVDYITKPFKFREVIARVENHLTIMRQRRQIEETKEKERQYFETLSRMKDQFISAATHDLKNPLALIMGYTGLLRSNDYLMHDPDSASSIEGIRIGSEKLKRLITEMLDLIQIESGIKINKSSVSLKEFLYRCWKVYCREAENKDIQFILSPSIRHISVYIDIARMERVLDNLISNAIKYTPEGGTVQISTAESKEYFQIIVTDTGLGIPKEDISHLFEAFYRVRQQQHMEIEGTGLGLSIVKSIIDQHHGTIEVESKLGFGSKFVITLPL